MNLAMNRQAIAEALWRRVEPLRVHGYHPQLDSALWPGSEPRLDSALTLYGYDPQGQGLLRRQGIGRFEFPMYLYTLPGLPRWWIWAAMALDWQIGLKPSSWKLTFPGAGEIPDTKRSTGGFPIRHSFGAPGCHRLAHKPRIRWRTL